MKKVFLFTLTSFALINCSERNKKQPDILDLEGVAKFALYKPVKQVLDSLKLSADSLIFIDEPPGIIRSIKADYGSRGTIEFFFEQTSIISNNRNVNNNYLIAVANKIIEEVQWKDANGKSGKMKKVITY